MLKNNCLTRLFWNDSRNELQFEIQKFKNNLDWIWISSSIIQLRNSVEKLSKSRYNDCNLSLSFRSVNNELSSRVSKDPIAKTSIAVPQNDHQSMHQSRSINLNESYFNLFDEPNQPALKKDELVEEFKAAEQPIKSMKIISNQNDSQWFS